MKANAWLNHLLSLAIAGLFLLPVLDVLCVLATGPASHRAALNGFLHVDLF